MKNELDTEFFEKAADIAKSLGNGRRMQILELLSHGDKSVERIANCLDVGITSVSGHLQILKNSGIVHARKDGVKVFYSLTDKSVFVLLGHVKNITAQLDHTRSNASFPLITENSLSLSQLIVNSIKKIAPLSMSVPTMNF
jgi:DNA-binding transcriptional ArsR family regulator